ncbi:unnamed protein product [Amoebophrya sp. A25]|nr:unnamed protein product [Amoebophrya sp. A25]|eukprot:GSA25T00026953001.1
MVLVRLINVAGDLFHHVLLEEDDKPCIVGDLRSSLSFARKIPTCMLAVFLHEEDRRDEQVFAERDEPLVDDTIISENTVYRVAEKTWRSLLRDEDFDLTRIVRRKSGRAVAGYDAEDDGTVMIRRMASSSLEKIRVQRSMIEVVTVIARVIASS